MTSPPSELNSINQLVAGSFRPVEFAPRSHLVGIDGKGWFQKVGEDHDLRANKSSLEELRNQIRCRIVTLIDSPGAKRQRKLLRMLELAVIRSDKALLDAVKLVGVTPSGGLYKQIKEILVEAEGLDPDSDLWRLLSVDP
ncbi:hypothetical protein [Polaromonas sp.]|uniref:hypothetical protein n=1 Tax=Polaromonas sp. TaxID=1869339 RepID=UPI00180AEA38|nr:hypothetical protein [Polaromonas sp.]NML85775.1 hypothetical protein [Polaromonas sp.]